MGGQQPSPHSGSPLIFPEHSGLRAEQQAEGLSLIVGCFFVFFFKCHHHNVIYLNVVILVFNFF